jgi:hypothetical protein
MGGAAGAGSGRTYQPTNTTPGGMMMAGWGGCCAHHTQAGPHISGHTARVGDQTRSRVWRACDLKCGRLPFAYNWWAMVSNPLHHVTSPVNRPPTHTRVRNTRSSSASRRVHV